MDTLQLDSIQLAAFQQDPRYDYDRELVGGSQNLLEWIATVISDWLSETFNVLMDNDAVYYTLVGVGVLLVGFLGWIVWKKNPKLFMHPDDGTPDYDVEEDTIYGIDFDAEIRQALGQHDYRQSVRLLYLQTLKQLSDAGRIDWQPSKTPMQYMRQMNDAAFRELSNDFIRVRYGNFEATEELFMKMKQLQATCCGAAETPEPPEPPESKQSQGSQSSQSSQGSQGSQSPQGSQGSQSSQGSQGSQSSQGSQGSQQSQQSQQSQKGGEP